MKAKRFYLFSRSRDNWWGCVTWLVGNKAVWWGGCGLCEMWWGKISVLTWKVFFPVRNCFRSSYMCRNNERQKWVVVPQRLLKFHKSSDGSVEREGFMPSLLLVFCGKTSAELLKQYCQTSKHLFDMILAYKWTSKCGWIL